VNKRKLLSSSKHIKKETLSIHLNSEAKQECFPLPLKLNAYSGDSYQYNSKAIRYKIKNT
jgi:hypothetical protein